MLGVLQAVGKCPKETPGPGMLLLSWFGRQSTHWACAGPIGLGYQASVRGSLVLVAGSWRDKQYS